MRVVPTAHRFPGTTPLYGEGRGPLLDLECELNGCAVFLSPRELADALATRGVLDWPRVREALEAKGWASPETVEAEAEANALEVEVLEAERDEAIGAYEKVAATVTLLKQRAPKVAGKQD